ncbi:MAG: IS4 family transposase [Nevskiales bacterium]
MVHGRFFRRLVELRSRLSTAPELPFTDALTQNRIDAVLSELHAFYRERVYTPCVTLWVFLSQVLSADHSCRDAVARLLAFRTAQGHAACSTDTGSYCEARQRLPLELLTRLVRQTGAEQHRTAPAQWRLHGRPVKVVDGSTVSMPDTSENAAEFGKPSNQRGGGLFPVARLVVLLCLTTGVVLDMACGPYRGKHCGELSLFRAMNYPFQAGDILLGDRLFCTYCDIARLRRAGVDLVFRLNAARRADFRRGRRLGHDDHVLRWRKPTRRPDWLSEAEFAALPDELELREVRVRVKLPGFRVRSLIVVTTLLDPQQFSKHDVAELFRQRWHAELDLRSIKTVMQMDVLRCKTPEMVRKELWVHLLAYNLLRSVMCAAAAEHELPVRQLSFKGTMQLLNAFYHLLVTSAPDALESLCTSLLHAVQEHRVGDRPNRYEPRKRKRAAKPYAPLKKPRDEERKLCLRNS